MRKSAVFGLKMPKIADFYVAVCKIFKCFISFCYQKTLPFLLNIPLIIGVA